ncbi:hypothetical protein KUCAC02_008781, partial [Chaenocephalus aceratus]
SPGCPVVSHTNAFTCLRAEVSPDFSGSKQAVNIRPHHSIVLDSQETALSPPTPRIYVADSASASH